MRIIITINTSWNIYNFRAGLIQALLKEGHEVIAVAPPDEFSDKLRAMGCAYYPIKIENTGVNPLNDLKLYLGLKKLYKKIRPHIILQYTVKPNIYGSLAAQSLKIPTINNVSGLGTVFLSKSISSKIAKFLYQIAFRKVPLVFFQNSDDQKDFIRELSLKNLKSDLLPGSGINLEHYTPSQEGISSGSFVFLMIARAIIEKGINEYANAARIVKAKFPNATFELLGQIDESHKRGVSKSTIRQWQEDGLITHLGECEDVRSKIAASSCVVLPSYREGTPRTLLEAAAMGKPIITTDVPGCKEVVQDGYNGHLCAVKNSEDLADKMIKMISLDEKELEKMGHNGRKWVEDHFDEKIVIEKYLKHIDNIIIQNPA